MRKLIKASLEFQEDTNRYSYYLELTGKYIHGLVPQDQDPFMWIARVVAIHLIDTGIPPSSKR